MLRILATILTSLSDRVRFRSGRGHAGIYPQLTATDEEGLMLAMPSTCRHSMMSGLS